MVKSWAKRALEAIQRPREVTPFEYASSKGKLYYLHGKVVRLKSGHERVNYFFTKEPRAGAISNIPQGYEVVEAGRSGLPVLRKIQKG